MKFKRKLKSILVTSLFLLSTLIAGIGQVAASGKNQYYLSFLYNPDSKSFGALVAQNGGRARMEESFSSLDTNDSLIKLSVSSTGFAHVVAPGKMKQAWVLDPNSETVVGQGLLTYFPFTFPEFSDVDGQMSDYSMANNVGSELTKSLNSAIKLILKPVSTEGRKELQIDDSSSFFRLATEIANSGYDVISANRTTFTSRAFGKLNWSIRQATEDDMKAIKGVPKGATFRDYVVVRNYNNESVVLPFLYPKGYSSGQELAGQIPTANDESTITAKLSWSHVVYLSNAHLSRGATTMSPGLVNKEDAFSKAIAGFLNTIISFLIGAMGLHTVEELMFNAGTRGVSHYYGIMPMSWLHPVNILNLVATVISLIVIGISIARLLIRRNIAAITPSVKADLMEGVKDLFIVAVGILLFMPFLYVLLNFNQTIVVALRNLSPSGSVLGLTRGAGFFGLGEAIMQIAYLFILLSLNITYIIRSVTLVILIGFAPFFISMFGAGGASKKISFTWMKELLANIFMQTFNAAMLLVFTNIAVFGALSMIERFALLISFIPLTKFFKTGLMGLGSSADAIGEKTSGAFTGLASGLAAGALMSRFDGKSEKNGKVVPEGSGGKNWNQGQGNKASASSSGIPKENSEFGTSSRDAEKNKSWLKGAMDSVNPKHRKIMKEATSMAGKALTTGVIGGGVSLGSAATGGSPLIANAAIIKGTQSMMNQGEGWFTPNDNDGIPIEMGGDELFNYGISGFDGDHTMFSSEARENINSDPDEFMSRVEAHNEAHPESRMKPIYNSDKSSIVGAKVEGLSGKTLALKDFETGKTLSSESTVIGKSKLDSVRDIVKYDYKGSKQAQSEGKQSQPVQPREESANRDDYKGSKQAQSEGKQSQPVQPREESTNRGENTNNESNHQL